METKMKKLRIHLAIMVVTISLVVPGVVFAAPVPKNSYAFNYDEMTAQAYMVVDKASGQVLLEKNADMPWTPASLTKLVTAMVVLDLNPKLSGAITMAKADEVGGARIATKAGVKYPVKGLLYASLVASANNATNALARSTGLSKEEFVKRMNEKAMSVGAIHSTFVEPTGIDPANSITARDYSHIAQAAFGYGVITDADNRVTYTLQSTGSGKKYTHKLKTTNRLLADGSFLISGAKTGYLEESRYNFAAELKDVDGKNIIVVLLGSVNSTAQFFETKKLAIWTWTNFAWTQTPQVAGVSTMGLQMPVN